MDSFYACRKEASRAQPSPGTVPRLASLPSLSRGPEVPPEIVKDVTAGERSHRVADKMIN